MDVLAAYERWARYRGAAEICGTTHKTVRRIVERARGRAGRGAGARRERGHNYDAVADAGRRAGRRRRRGGSRRSGCCRRRGRPAMRGRRGTSAGWSRRRSGSGGGVITAAAGRRCGRRVTRWSSTGACWRGLHVFCAVLAWSRVRFVRFADNETRRHDAWRCWRSASRRSAGCPKVVLADRMGCLKAGVVANVVVPTADYVRFATHYGFRPDFCEAADPESKGIVENLVGYAKTRSDGARSSRRRRPVRRRTPPPAAWCAEVNAATHSEICAVPAERLEPGTGRCCGRCRRCGPRSGPRPVSRKVDKLSCVRFGSARYSVPNRLIGTPGHHHQSPDGLIVMPSRSPARWSPSTPLVAPGETSIVDEHYGRPGRTSRAGRRGPRPQAEKRFLRPRPGRRGVPGRRRRGRGDASWPPSSPRSSPCTPPTATTALLAALERAVEFGRWRADDVRSILAAGRRRPAAHARPGRRWC